MAPFAYFPGLSPTWLSVLDGENGIVALGPADLAEVQVISLSVDFEALGKEAPSPLIQSL